MRIAIFSLIVALACLTRSVAAEPLGIGVGRSGLQFYTMAIAIGKVLTAHEDIEFRPRTHRGSGEYLPLVDNGELELGIANALELGFAFNGTGVYEGRPHPGLRLIGATYPFRIALFTLAENRAETAADLAGLRLPGGFDSAQIANVLIDAILANAGVSRDTVEFVPVTGFGQMFDDFSAGKLDVLLSILGTGAPARLEQKTGKLRALSAVQGESALAAVRQHIPMATIEPVDPGEGLAGVEETIYAITYDVLLFANKDLPDDAAYAIAKTMSVRRAEIIESDPSFALLDNDELAPQIGLPYHPGAERYYRESGTWPSQ